MSKIQDVSEISIKNLLKTIGKVFEHEIDIKDNKLVKEKED